MQLLNGAGNGCVLGVAAVTDTATVNAILNSAEARRVLPANLKARWSVKAEDEKGKYFTLVALKTSAGKPVLNGDDDLAFR